MAIPGSSELSSVTCATTDGSGGGTTGGVTTGGGFCPDAACDNPLYRYDHQTECGSLTLVSLRLEPASIAVPKGRVGVVRVIAQFSTGQEADVTLESVVNTADTDTAAYQGDGVVYGADQGITTIRGVWQGRTADGTVSVTDSACQSAVPWDVVFVLDQAVGNYFFRSTRFNPGTGAYFTRYTPAVSPYIDLYDWFTLSMQMGMDLTSSWNPNATGNDRVAIVVTGDGTPATLPGSGGTPWSSSVRTTSAIGILGASRLGAAVDRARTIMDGARPEARKLIVVLTHAGETDCTPTALAECAAAKADGLEVAIVTPVAASHVEFFSSCSYPLTVFEYLQSCASPCLFMSGNSKWWAAGSTLTNLLQTACGCSYSGVAIGLGGL